MSLPDPILSPEVTAPSAFVPLCVHSHFSLLEAASHIGDIIAIAKTNGWPAVGLSDSGVMYGMLEFYNGCKAAGIQPIIGMEAFLIAGDITERQNRQPWYHLPLFCKNLTGYRNLCRLASIAQTEGFYYKPRINWDVLEQNSEGLIALTGDMAGVLGRPLMRAMPEMAREHAQRLKTIFGPDCFVELQDHGKEAEQRLNADLVALAQEFDLPLVITNGSRFSRPGDHEVLNTLLCMQEGKTASESTRGQFYGPEYYLKSADELRQRFVNIAPEVREQALSNSLVIAERCRDLDIPQGESLLPAYPIPEDATEDSELRRISFDYAAQKYNAPSPEALPEVVTERLNYELGVISQMGFPAYFLIVWDFIDWARKRGIPVGPGRGSAAGSLVAYVLGITNLDPIEHNLLFERFLNPERVSMPDIDIDFCIDRREEVIQYVRDRYGANRVCQIATFGTLAARAAVKAVARVQDIPFSESDRLAKMIPTTPGTKLKDALADGMPLAVEVASNPDIAQWIELAKKMEGIACNVGVHAAGVVIAKDPLLDVVPIQRTKDGQIVSQLTMGDLEKLGLLKMDFLGLRNLTIIHNALNHIERHTGERIDIDHVPLDDPKVYTLLSAGETDGVFQLESSGMKALERDLKPSTFEDINALVALFRPGPLNSGMAKSFVDRKHGREAITVDHPALEPVLQSTYGTIVYQEQIMQITQVLAGYSLGRADLLRRAMGKKKADVMAKERDGFVSGCVENEVDEAVANKLFDAMTEFAAYCFNRSHSAAYAFVAYQTAYLKVHHPVAYLSALLSSVSSDLDKIQYYILTARKMGIAILPPDVCLSEQDFAPDGENIRFGLASIKNVGLGVVQAILEARTEAPFAGLDDFLKRVDPKILNRKTLESLILGGAFSGFGYTRKHLFDNVDTLIQFGTRAHEQRASGQSSLFDLMAASNPDASQASGLMLSGNPLVDYTDGEIQQHEKALLGFYLSSHPLDAVATRLPEMVTHTIAKLKSLTDGTKVMIGGLLGQTQQRQTKKGLPMAIATVEDFTSSIEILAFRNTALDLAPVWQDGHVLIVEGSLSVRGDDGEQVSVMVDKARVLEDVKPLELQFSMVPRYEDVAYLGRLLAQCRGDVPVFIRFPDGSVVKTGTPFWVDAGLVPTSLTPSLLSHFGAQVVLSQRVG